MCGIGAILRADGAPIPEAWLDAIDARIAHRGPDGSGRFREEVTIDTRAGTRRVGIALVHRRLSILDHGGGAQPMVAPATAEHGACAVAFNGCIYNHRALRAELEAAGHAFTSDHSDTEVLLHGHRAWGPELVDRLEGMYAFALWDARVGGLAVARDWFGEKPLFRGTARGLVVVASDAAAVAAVLAAAARERGEGDGSAGGDDEPPSPPIAWTGGYLRLGYGAGGDAAFAGVTAVPIGLPDPLPPATGAGSTLQEALPALLEQAVASRLEADVPLGCFLSGGVDSSLVALHAHRQLGRLRTFSVRMPDARYDESEHAERVAQHLGTEHTTLDVEPEPARDLVALVEALGQPFGDSSILPTYWVSRAAREHVTVALSGDGGDELFLGYDRYRAARALVRHATRLRMLPPDLGRKAHPKSARHRVGRLGRMARDLDACGVLAMESIFDGATLAGVLAEGAQGSIEPVPPGSDAMQALRASDLRQYLPYDLLAKVDHASMMVALEVRCPFLDRRLVSAVLATDPDALVASGRKGMLRDVARCVLPASVVDRPKMGFAIPIGDWLRSDHGGLRALFEDAVLAPDALDGLPVRVDAVRRLAERHMDGEERGQELFTLLTLGVWWRWRRRTTPQSGM